jgi:hypothetical protein
MMPSATKYSTIIVLALSSLLIFGCGTVQTTSRGITENTSLVVIGTDIVGLTVFIDDIEKMQVDKNNLDRFQMGLLGVKNSTRENSQTITIPLKPGFHKVKIQDGARSLVETKILLSAGQTKELILE